jgi:hypothetical protein
VRQNDAGNTSELKRGARQSDRSLGLGAIQRCNNAGIFNRRTFGRSLLKTLFVYATNSHSIWSGFDSALSVHVVPLIEADCRLGFTANVATLAAAYYRFI